jgi:hypothetical protein
MGSLFTDIQKTYSEHEFWNTLTNNDKVNFLFDMYTTQMYSSKLINLETFFKEIKGEIDSIESDNTDDEHVESIEFETDASDRVNVMIDDLNMMIESNNLKALRAVTYKFVESGYILQRDTIMEKLFRKDKITRYLRIFRIINQSTDLCFN